MTLFSRVRVLAAGAAIASLVSVGQGIAQTTPAPEAPAAAPAAPAGDAPAAQISESHLKAARAAINAIDATGEYDAILPAAARALKDQLTQQSPDLFELIDKTVNEKAMALTARYADLQNEAANAYARNFSEAELNAITAFYTSDAGKKLLDRGPIVTREVIRAADIWQRGIARDLAAQVAEVLASQGAPKAEGGESPVTPATPVVPQGEAPAPAQN